jgi:prepilin-type processing-associated H-X9-DG protein
MLAWQMYLHDNNDRIVIALHGGAAMNGVGDPVLGKGWVSGWLNWGASTDNTNVDFLISEQWAKLGQYAAKSKNIFKCPADVYLQTSQRALGWKERVRSFSGNIGVGAGNAETGPWDAIYQHYTKSTQFIYPGPAQTWVFVDEHPDSMNDAGFFNPRGYIWVDMPAAYHNGACGFAFADGHSEIHKWKGSLTRPREREVKYTDGGDMPALLGGGLKDIDIQWMMGHAGTKARF